jgi:hypothetical protein
LHEHAHENIDYCRDSRGFYNHCVGNDHWEYYQSIEFEKIPLELRMLYLVEPKVNGSIPLTSFVYNRAWLNIMFDFTVLKEQLDPCFNYTLKPNEMMDIFFESLLRLINQYSYALAQSPIMAFDGHTPKLDTTTLAEWNRAIADIDAKNLSFDQEIAKIPAYRAALLYHRNALESQLP